MKTKILLVLIILLLQPTQTTGINNSKIVPLEEWQYTDGVLDYNETAIETIQFVTDDGVVPVSVVNTTRKTENNLKYNRILLSSTLNVSLNISIVENLNEVMITQVGGFPLFSKSLVTGTANLTTHRINSSGEFDWTDTVSFTDAQALIKLNLFVSWQVLTITIN